MTGEGLTLVSVVFEAEYPLLRLQARSLARFLDRGLADGIVVIDNSWRGMPDTVRRALMSEYGELSGVVQILRPDDISRVPGTIGWRSQQVLKLQVADRIDTDTYVALDAKNHLVRPLRPSDVVGPDGRARVNVYGYERHPLRPSLEHVLRYVDLEPGEHLSRFTATVTPFVLYTDVVRAMIRDVERRSGRGFADEFVAHGLTEFFLYTGWLLARGERPIEELYEFQQVDLPVIWPRGVDPDDVAATIQRASDHDPPVFSVHRTALAKLEPASRDLLAGFWAGRGLFDSTDEARQFIVDFRRSFTRARSRKRIRELPYRAAARAQQAWRRRPRRG